jgi:hypothetical protein
MGEGLEGWEGRGGGTTFAPRESLVADESLRTIEARVTNTKQSLRGGKGETRGDEKE